MLFSQLAIGQTLYTFNGGGTTGDWSDPSVWTTDPTGSTSIGATVPTSSNSVVVTNSFILTLRTTLNAAATPSSVTIQRGGTLNLVTTTAPAPITSGGFAPLARLAGQGTLRIGRPYFPVVTNNDFDDANTGTVEYYNWAAGSTNDLPTGVMYNNLRLLNTNTAVIGNAYTVQLDYNLTVNGNLTLLRASNGVAGTLVTLNMGKTANTARTLTVLGNINVGNGTRLGVTAVNGVHRINASGSFTNDGTVNLRNGADTQTALLNFTGTTEARFAVNNSTDLGILRVDKGIDSQVLLDITGAINFASSAGYLRLNHAGNGDILQLVNGITRLGENITLPRIHNGNPAILTDPAGWYQLGTELPVGSGNYTSPTLWIDGATVNNDTPSADLFVIYGVLRISGGTLTSRSDGGLVIREDGQFLMEGSGNAIVNKFRPSSNPSGTRTHRGSFTMTGGTLTVDGVSNPNSTFEDGFARFALPYTTQAFRMSGGTIEVKVPNSNPSNNTNDLDGFFHVGVDPNNAAVTGGTIKLFLPSTGTNCKVLSTAPLWNLSIIRAATGGTSKSTLR